MPQHGLEELLVRLGQLILQEILLTQLYPEVLESRRLIEQEQEVQGRPRRRAQQALTLRHPARQEEPPELQGQQVRSKVRGSSP